MTTRETLPLEKEPYTKSYYAIWGALSLGAIVYIAFLAFGPGHSSIIKISTVAEGSQVAAKLAEQQKRVSTAMTIAAQARAKSISNSKRLESLEKRMQLITWKVADQKPGSEGSKDGAHKAYAHLKQVIGGSNTGSSIVGAVREAAPSGSAQLVKSVAAQAVQKIVPDEISSIAGIVDNAPVTGSEIVGHKMSNLSTLNPLKVAAVSAGIAKAADMIAGDGKAKPGSKVSATTSHAVQKVALKTPTETAKAVAPARPRIVSVPLPVRKSYGVRLVSGRSAESLRLTWDLINEMNRPILKGLKPRFVKAPGKLGMPYRLIAGPIASAPQAQSLCAKFHKQNINCDVTVFKGHRL